jgi:CrcB protein
MREGVSGEVDYVWIALGAAVGANARYIVGQLMARRFGSEFPYGTLLVNISGSLLIGIIFTLLTDRLLADTHWRLLLVVGLLGGYTTFSSFSYEVIAMLEDGRWLPALTYISTSVLLSIAGCYAGVVLARAVGG